jgi:hypothetical protein
MRNVMSGFACPRRLLIVTISTPRVDELARVGVEQKMKCHLGLPDCLGEVGPSCRYRIR